MRSALEPLLRRFHQDGVGDGMSAPAPERATSETSADIGNLFTESSCQIDLMVLLLDEDLGSVTDTLCQGVA